MFKGFYTGYILRVPKGRLTWLSSLCGSGFRFLEGSDVVFKTMGFRPSGFFQAL